MGYAQNWWRYQIEVDLRHSGIYIVNCKRSTLVWCFYCFFTPAGTKDQIFENMLGFPCITAMKSASHHCVDCFREFFFFFFFFFFWGNCCFKQSDWFLLQGKFLFSLIMKVTSFVTEVLFLHMKVKFFMLLLTRYSISIALFILLFL